MHQGLNFTEKVLTADGTSVVWDWPADRLTGPHMAAVSFPKRDLQRVVVKTKLDMLLEWFSGSPGREDGRWRRLSRAVRHAVLPLQRRDGHLGLRHPPGGGRGGVRHQPRAAPAGAAGGGRVDRRQRMVSGPSEAALHAADRPGRGRRDQTRPDRARGGRAAGIARGEGPFAGDLRHAQEGPRAPAPGRPAGRRGRRAAEGRRQGRRRSDGAIQVLPRGRQAAGRAVHKYEYPFLFLLQNQPRQAGAEDQLRRAAEAA